MNELYASILSAESRRQVAVLREIASDLPLGDILLELREFYRDAQNDDVLRAIPDYQEICDTSLRALDAALHRLESAEIALDF